MARLSLDPGYRNTIMPPTVLLSNEHTVLPEAGADDIRRPADDVLFVSDKGVQSSAVGSFSVKLADVELKVTALSQGAIRVQCAPVIHDHPDDLVLVNLAHDPEATLERVGANLQLSSSIISATYNSKNESIRFTDPLGAILLDETVNGRRVTPSTIQGEPTLAAEVSFDSAADEYLYGSGQFQDGHLNIRDLPRRLTRVNTQIAIPFVVSNKGYGLLWNNQGLTDWNPTDKHLAVERGVAGHTNTEGSTTSEGSQLVTRTAQTFSGIFEVAKTGRYAMMLDIGQNMAQRYNVIIDGVTIMDLANPWLPPTTSWFSKLEAGNHHIIVEGFAADKPVLHWRLSAPRTVFRSPVSEGIDYIVFAGSTPDLVIARYRQVTGEAPLMPLWAYGFLQCRERYSSSPQIVENAKQFRQRGLPMDIMIQDWLYWGKYGWNAMQWDEEFYPDPASMVHQLHALQARLVVSVWSKIDPESELGQEFTTRNLYIPGTQWIDFSNPAAQSFYWESMSSRMLSLGIDGWWLDATEPENDALANVKTFAGLGDKIRLLYPLLVNRTVYEGQRKDAPNQRVFILSRSAFLGQQRYASATWSGDIGHDWETFRRQITAGLGYAISGLPYWTTDTGGFFRPGQAQYSDRAYHERYIRWLQFSTFTPLMRVHGYETDTEPWHYGEEVEQLQRAYLEFRHRLVPYIYSQAAAISFNGSTLMRPLVMDFACDSKALEQKYEYMFGPAFLVAPVFESGVSQWRVYAPVSEGGWFDWWTDATVTSGTEALVETPLSRIPLLVRAGSVIPFGPVKQYTGQCVNSDLEIRVYPGRDGTFDLYEDIGTDYTYEQGERSTIRFEWDDISRCLTISERHGEFPGVAKTRCFSVRLSGTLAHKSVTYSGDSISITFTDL